MDPLTIISLLVKAGFELAPLVQALLSTSDAELTDAEMAAKRDLVAALHERIQAA